MDFFLDLGVTVVRSVGSIVFLFVLTKIMGAKQISQMTFFDYIIGISIGSIVGILAVERDIHFAHPLVSMAAYALIDLGISVASRKSITARRLFTGTPCIVVYDGKLIEKNMKKVHYDVNELLAMCRLKGYYNIADIYCGILETNGDLSVLPVSEKRPVQPADLQLCPAQESVPANIVIDGRVMEKNLKTIGRDRRWLKKRLAEQGYHNTDDILLATCDAGGALSVYEKNRPCPREGTLD